ncbi:zinc ribbon domain-containing protein [Halorubrum rutilum]|uniref:Zinc ribbon domain-containing protein n=1 Tax=Halorubrum rutilum TaxID=1364933 RepID=A0ABD6ANF6_9EURY|nr:zinc ribbon domain-containing protein [Halorubrum rutilum]
MVDASSIYLAVTGVLLFVALGAGLHVLRGIVREGRDLRRRRRAGEAETYPEDEEYDPGPPAGPEDEYGRTTDPSDSGDPDAPTATCPQCGADNESGFDYCRRCAAPLGPAT